MNEFKKENSIYLEELALKAQGGDKKNLEDLIIYFKPYIKKQALCTYVKGYDIEDLIQIGYISLIKAINMYKPLNKNFEYYALASIKRNFYYLIRKESRHNAEYSMDFETGEGLTLQDGIEDDFNLEEEHLKKETYKQLKKVIKLLNEEEQSMIKWVYFDRRSLKSYAESMGITYSQSRYKIKQVIKKLRESFE
ncbi:sigma-70 family RNA polymerase sigma factor [Clostridium peptidivorans]|uniref:sigma-70 family RNA polymerase sigma factor n=1 Tax=Clostridium peptidivorans TaxID=100174 RepID=UPI00117732BF|nr:sigma-70 family RNA polymerase sigma factor [Clostridium peptidivorans]